MTHTGAPPTRVPLRTVLTLAGRQLDYWVTTYRRTWRGSAVSSFLLPVLFLTAMGVGLGSFIDGPDARQSLDGVSYLAFVAPGLLAATAMQTAIGESTYPVYANFKWTKVYLSMIATPIVPASIVLAHLTYVAFRLVTTCAVFIIVLSLFGLVPSVLGGVLALLAATLIGMAHATPVFAYASRLNSDHGFAPLARLGVMPMFLFSGAFFPVSQLPWVFEWLAYVTPLFHGVELTRALVTDGLSAAAGALHVTYLLVWLLAGWWLAQTGFTKRLVG